MAQTQKSSPIAVTGMGCCCAAGQDVAKVWDSLQQKRVNCTPVPAKLFSTELSYPVFAIDSWSPQEQLSKLYQQNIFTGPFLETNRTLLLTLQALHEALQSADLSRRQLKNKRVGIVLGTTVGCLFNDEEYFINWRDGLRPDPGPVHDFLATHLALYTQQALGTSGPISVITNACASGTDAIGVAAGWLQNDLCDLVIAGGADELSRIAYHGFSCLMLTSPDPCTPFAPGRKGLNLGEGAGILILEQAKNTKPNYGWIRGYGSAGDAYHPTAPHPRGRGLVNALKQALNQAGVNGEDINFINSHGTGTKANDLAETTALSLLNFSQKNCPVISTKGITGHTLGAAGAIEAILTLLTLNKGKTPGTVGCTIPDSELPFPVLAEQSVKALRGKLGISQSLAFGGSNSALLFEGNQP